MGKFVSATEQLFPDVPRFVCSNGGSLADRGISLKIAAVAAVFEKTYTKFFCAGLGYGMRSV